MTAPTPDAPDASSGLMGVVDGTFKAATLVTATTREALAELVNGGPLPANPNTVGGIYERHTAYERADAIIADGWVYLATITNDEATVATVVQVINEEGGEPGNGLHSWRCEYPDRYGKCDCVELTAQMILAALRGQR